jgi:hypothetical protein
MMQDMVKYWTSKKSRSVVEERRAELDLLIAFANADLTTPVSRHLQTRALDHLYRHPALHPDNRNWKVDVQPDHIIGAVQQRLRLRLGKHHRK